MTESAHKSLHIAVVALVVLSVACVMAVGISTLPRVHDDFELMSEAVTSNEQADIAALKVSAEKERIRDGEAYSYISAVRKMDHEDSPAYRKKRIQREEATVKANEKSEISYLKQKTQREISSIERRASREIHNLQVKTRVMALREKIASLQKGEK